MFRPRRWKRGAGVTLIGLLLTLGYALAQQAGPNPYMEGTAGPDQGPRGLTSYMPVAITESFAALMTRLSAEKPGVEQAHNALLNERYDLSDHPAQGGYDGPGKTDPRGGSRQIARRGDLGEPGGDEPGPDP